MSAVSAAPEGLRSVAAGTGIVTAMQQRQEADFAFRIQMQVWDISPGAPGTGLPPVPVEMKAYTIRGQVINGDNLEIPRRANPRRLKNHTTGVKVRARGTAGGIWYRAAGLCFLMFILLDFLVKRHSGG